MFIHTQTEIYSIQVQHTYMYIIQYKFVIRICMHTYTGTYTKYYIKYYACYNYTCTCIGTIH